MHAPRSHAHRAGGLFFLGTILTLVSAFDARAASAQYTSDSPASGVIIVSAPTPVYTPAPVLVAPEPVPARRSHTQVGLIVSGAVVLGVGWIVNFFTGLLAGTDLFDGSSALWDDFRLTSLIPIAGPWVQLAVKPTDFRQDLWGPWLIFNGIWQGAGAVLLIAGLATIGDEEVAVAETNGVRWSLLPTVTPTSGGLSVVGSF